MWSLIIAVILLFASISRLREVRRFDWAGAGFLVIALVFGSISANALISKRAESAQVAAQAPADIKRWSSEVEDVLRKSDMALNNYRGLASNADQIDPVELYQKIAKLRDIQDDVWNELRQLPVPNSVRGDDRSKLSDARNSISTGVSSRRTAMAKVLAYLNDGRPGDLADAEKELQDAQAMISQGLAVLQRFR